ncbi:MAG: bifunctional ADP-dependent NAD(P)H-hydrate dehydratase/NAD(P)H-hydrate epimerase [Desulfuromonas sp.]|nr:MAG: bifunctional ADP-dependent NAD(P)H-hydrate dehydratase/NAD(P)H-hydrate epimerase [Desulfuromonas sp.]
MKLLTAEQMRKLDQCAIEQFGVPGIVLMENAGRGAAMKIAERYAAHCPGPVLVVAGKGNNGGDGYVIARHLENCGWLVKTVVLAAREAIKGDAATNLDILLHSGCSVAFAPDAASFVALELEQQGFALIVDAIFGNGLNSEVTGHYRDVIAWLNCQPAPVTAVDMPSGVEATSGRILGCAVIADSVFTFAFAKLGQVSYPAQACAGNLEVVDLGMPRCLCDGVSGQYCLVGAAQAAELLPRRPTDGHKGTFGHLLVVAGSAGKVGAARMAAHAALRSGCGLVSAAIEQSLVSQLMVETPEIMARPLHGRPGQLSAGCCQPLADAWADMAAVAAGPGLGTDEQIAELISFLVDECPLPVVLDADALTVLAAEKVRLARRQAPTVITPHPGEMARLTGLSIDAIQQNRIEVAREFARQHQICVVLKGARTVIADETRVWINSTGNSGMASGGMGDVLTGMVGALMAQGLEPFDAAVLGVYLHGLAADLCQRQYGDVGYLASDVLAAIPVARQTLQEGK